VTGRIRHAACSTGLPAKLKVSGLKLHGPMDVRITVGSGRRGRHGAAKALCKSKNVASCVASIKTPASGRATRPAPVNLHVSIIAPTAQPRPRRSPLTWGE
jgi:hypothetical protein